jgi:hypothetical protein
VGGLENEVEQEGVSHVGFMQNPLFYQLLWFVC